MSTLQFFVKNHPDILSGRREITLILLYCLWREWVWEKRLPGVIEELSCQVGLLAAGRPVKWQALNVSRWLTDGQWSSNPAEEALLLQQGAASDGGQLLFWSNPAMKCLGGSPLDFTSERWLSTVSLHRTSANKLGIVYTGRGEALLSSLKSTFIAVILHIYFFLIEVSPPHKLLILKSFK